MNNAVTCYIKIISKLSSVYVCVCVNKYSGLGDFTPIFRLLLIISVPDMFILVNFVYYMCHVRFRFVDELNFLFTDNHIAFLLPCESYHVNEIDILYPNCASAVKKLF